MRLHSFEENEKIVSSLWALTYKVGWEHICKAIYSVYDYFKSTTVRVDGENVAISDKWDILELEEGGRMGISGFSTIVGVPLGIAIYNQTNVVRVNVQKTTQEFVNTDYQRLNNSLCAYMDSIELAMYRDV